MVRERRIKLRDEALELRSAGDFESAGDHFTWAAFEGLGESELSKEGASEWAIGDAIHCLQSAALCYRLAGGLERCQLRCEQGISIARELREFVLKPDPEKGLTFEYEGDFRVIGDLEGYEEAYLTAARYYMDNKPFDGWEGETLFVWNYKLFEELVNVTEHDVPEYLDLNYEFLHRVKYKRTEFPNIVQQLVEQGEWEGGTDKESYSS